MGKGISPIIATVLLVAFVISVVAIISTFFTDLTTIQKEKIEDEGSAIMDCALAWFEIDSDIINVGPEISVAVENKGQTELSGLKIVAYNDTGAFQLDATPSTMQIGGINILRAVYSGQPILRKIKVSTTGCPGVEDSINFELDYDENPDSENCTSTGYENITDGNWLTSAQVGVGLTLSINYTKPADAKGALWVTKDDGSRGCGWTIYGENAGGTNSIAIPNSCWKAYPNKIALNLDEPGGDLYWKCYNGTGWTTLIYSCDGSGYMFEEAIYWNVISDD